MDRKDFIKTCAYACLSGVAIATMVSSCTTTQHIDVPVSNATISLSEQSFVVEKKGKTSYRKYVVLHNETLPFPICVYRNEGNYTALYLRCTHQGAELQVFGEKIVCPAHGSEFNALGQVESGPAIDALSSFPITASNGNLIITLSV